MADAAITSVAPSPHPFDILLQLDQRGRERVPVAPEPGQLSDIRGRLALRLGAWNLLFSMDDVTEIIPIPRITRVPGVGRWLLGIANLRGKVISVSDLRDFLAGKPTLQTPNSQVVVLHSGEWDYGLLVDEIIGMRYFGAQHRQASPEDVEAGLLPYVVEAFSNDNQQWLVFNTSQLLGNPQFLNTTH